MFKPLKKSKTSIQIIEQIQNLIKSGELQPGQKLPSEKDLAAALDISRASLREALSAMEIMGVLYSKKGSGTYINTSIDVILENHFSQLRNLPEEITPQEILYARETLEIAAVKLSTVKATKEEIDKMKQCLDSMEKSLQESPNTDNWENFDKQFHHLIYITCGNRIFMKTSEYLEESMNKDFWLALKKEIHTFSRAQKYLSDHRAVLNAIKKRNPNKAASEMLKHLERVREDLFGKQFSMDGVLTEK